MKSVSDSAFHTPHSAGGSRAAIIFLAAIVLLSILVFSCVLPLDKYFFTTDDNIGQIALSKNMLPTGFLGSWNDSIIFGVPVGNIPVTWTNVLSWLMPLRLFVNWIHAIDLVIASFFLMLFLRVRRLGWAACAIGALVAFWLGSNLTLVYAGHTAKFGVLMFAAITLYCIQKASAPSIKWSILAGGAIGFMLTEQQDVGFFFGIFLGAYAMFVLLKDIGWRRKGVIISRLAVMLAVALLICIPAAWRTYSINVQHTTVGTEQGSQAKWDFCTQWSWPPEECIDFVAPGFMGWRSGEPAGPYYGRMGRSAGWERTKQGFRNFKLENQYLGATAIMLALFAPFLVWVQRKKKLAFMPDIIFWSLVTIVTLFLSFGKYFPLYRLFYQLPFVSAIRNPNKFLQVFQLALGILAAYGLHTAVTLSRSDKIEPYAHSKIRSFIFVVLALGGIMLIAALASILSWDSLVQRFAADGWGNVTTIIVQNRIRALVYGGLMMILGAAVLSILCLWKELSVRARQAIPLILISLVLIDVFFLSRHYVKTMPMAALKENNVIQVLKSAMPTRRVALTTQNGFYNFWLTYLFPYYHINTLNTAQMPRMPDDYKRFLGALSANPLRLWQLSAVRYVLGPSGLWTQVSNDPVMKDAFDIVFAYNVVDSNGYIEVSPATQSQPGKHCILRLKKQAPRVALLGSWQVADDEDALKKLSSNEFPLFESALIADDTAQEIPKPVSKGIVGSVQLLKYRPGYIKLKASTSIPTLLRLSEKYHKDWHVTIDGQPASLRRVDYIFQGVFVMPGMHEILFRYAPGKWSLTFQFIGIIICFSAAFSLLKKKKGQTWTMDN